MVTRQSDDGTAFGVPDDFRENVIAAASRSAGSSQLGLRKAAAFQSRIGDILQAPGASHGVRRSGLGAVPRSRQHAAFGNGLRG